MAVDYNPFDPAQVDDHDGVLATLRAECPVAEVMPGVFYVARYEDVVDVTRNHKVFGQGGFHPLDEDTRHPDQKELGETDPPFHTIVRKNLALALSPGRTRGFEPIVRDACERLVDGFAGRGQADLVADYSSPLPAQVIGRLSGLPEDDLPLVRAYSDDFIFAGLDAESDAAKEAKARCDAFDDHLRDVIAARRASGETRNDLLGALLECTDDEGHPISDERVLTHLSKDILVGGIETTTHFVANLFYQLLSTPGLYEKVRDDRTLVPTAVEESLRHLAPVQVVFRRTKEDASVAGTAVPASSVVVLGLASACRDDSVFPAADNFDLSRGDAAKRHLAFNGGIHLCVGAPLARLEGVCALDAVLDRIPHMELAPDEVYERVTFFMMRGPTHLRVQW